MLTILICSLKENYSVQSLKLLDFYRYSDLNKYRLTNNPKAADLILVCDVTFQDFGENIHKKRLIRKFINKCFVLSNIDRPLPIARGILTAGEKSWINLGRVRTCSYNGYSDTFKNPFIINHSYKNEENLQKRYLFSFIGRESDPIRKTIFNLEYKRKDVFIEDSGKAFNLYKQDINSVELQKHYYEIMLQSKFVLCPRGWGATSYRLFEALKLGLAPVIISDRWILPQGPDWKDFSIIVSEKEIGLLERKIAERENDFSSMGKLARHAYEKYFDDNVIFDYIIQSCLQIRKKQLIPESVFLYFISPLFIALLKFKNGKLISLRNGFNLIISKPFDLFKVATFKKIKHFFVSKIFFQL